MTIMMMIIIIIIIIIITIIINSPFTLVFFPLISANIQRTDSCKCPQFKRQLHMKGHQTMLS
jgi:hypothetical protein